ncbi:MAG TPA: squalene/phytoene synthase family protein [Caulobacterales bacterium]|nr:squalene/phytoene synthase family protein [Caulobacterales bacterium]
MRRADEDRWLAARFAPERTRRHLTTLYALNYEIARTAETVTQSPLGDIRLAWWREAIDEVRAGTTPRAHPVVQAFANLSSEIDLSNGALDLLISARARDLDPAPFATWGDLEAYIDATAGGVVRLAGQICGGLPEAFALDAGRAWGFVGLLRASAFWQARGRRVAPADIEPAEARVRMLAEAKRMYQSARDQARAMDHALFPSFGYLALCRGYLRRIERAQPVEAPLLLRQLALIGAAATGRL